MKYIDRTMTVLLVVIAGLMLLAAFSGCSSLPPVTSMSDDWCAAHPAISAPRCVREAIGYKVQNLPDQSWDQANLKKDDHGCPTAIFVAPGGNLTQCPPVVTQGEAGTTTYYPGGRDPGAPDLPMFKPKGLATPEDAATLGLKLIAQKATSAYYEWGGAIGRDPVTGEFYLSPPVTSMHGDHVNLEKAIDSIPDGYELVGSYHTHPCIPGHQTQVFSPGDLNGSIFNHETGFMGDFCTGLIHEFMPGDKPDVERIKEADLWLTQGRILGSFTTPRPTLVVE